MYMNKMLLKNSDQQKYFQMVQNMKVNGTTLQIWNMEKAIKYGAMEAYMKATGKMIKLVAEEG